MPSTSLLLLACLAVCAGSAQAYVPASPSNATLASNVTDFIQINWLPMGVSAYNDALNRQLVNSGGGNIAGYRGALVHFDETNATTATSTPWIALISCDGASGAPTTAFPSSSDAVSLALQMGAETAIIYSLTSLTCTLDDAIVKNLNGSLDLYVTTSQNSAQAIIRQFNNVQADAYWYNQTALEGSRNSINNEISSMGGIPTTATDPSLFGSTAAVSSLTSAASAAPTQISGAVTSYLLATTANAGANQNGTTVGTTQQQQQQQQGGGGANTGLAMIILYAITGCVTLLFLVVIMSGAIRAMRHPERYGPRARNPAGGAGGQSRAAGMTQAILDTFPVVKFLSGQKSPEQQREMQDGQAGIKDEETGDAQHIERRSGEEDASSVQMHVLNNEGNPEITSAHGRDVSNAATLVGGGAAAAAIHTRDATDNTFAVGEDEDEDAKDTGTVAAAAAPKPEEAAIPDTTDPADVNDSVTCPICLLDFEDGDDLRILPCDARHRFHDACVVPWLLNVSSLCPLCRLDLSKDRDPAVTTDGSSGPGETEAEETVLEAPPPTGSRLRASAVIRSLLHPSGTTPQNRSTATGNERNSLDDPTAVIGGAEGAEGQQQGTGSRFQRYVQQRRNRVNNRQRSQSTSMARNSNDNPRQHGLSPSGIPLSTVRP